MQQIRKHVMHTIELPDKNIRLQLPDHWDECTDAQVQYILERAFLTATGQMSIGEFRVQVFKKLSGIKFGLNYLVKQRLGLNKEINARIYQLSEQLCGWAFEEKEGGYELHYDTVQNHFPVLLGEYYGPADLLSDVTLGEFKTALSVLDELYQAKEDEAEANELLNLFIAQLYRSKTANTRTPFHEHIPSAEVFAPVPHWQKQAIVMWFSYCVHCLQTEDLTINGIDVNLRDLFPKVDTSHRRGVNLGWTGILMDIAESGTFGNAESTSRTSLYDVLLYLLKKHQDHKNTQKK